MSEKINKLADELKEKIRANNSSKTDLMDNLEKDNESIKNILNNVLKLQNENTALRQLLNNAEQINNNTLSTTQFFNPSLAEDFYNMNGNSLNTNSYMAIRQMLGIVNNNTPNVLQKEQGLNILPGGKNSNINGSAVGLTEARNIQGWWLWIMILNRIDYFANLFEIKTNNKYLEKAIKQYLFDVVLSGRAVIVKTEENKYKTYCVTNVKLNEEDDITEFDYYNSNFVINAESKDLGNNVGLFKSDKLNKDSFIMGSWKHNGYNIWFYIMAYLMNATDLLYIYWNRARLNKQIVLQKKGNSSTSSIEAYNFLNPYQNLVTINSVSILDDENNDNAKIELENRYEVISLGDGEQTEYSFTSFLLWLDYWDNLIGIRSNPMNTNTNRSISNEIEPQVLKLTHLQDDMLSQLQYFVYEIKEKWNEEVEVSLKDEVLIKQIENNGGNPAFKSEEGNETENDNNNGEAE